MNTQKQYHGFSTILLIIIIALVLALLGFLGWRAWEAASKDPVASSADSTEKLDVTDEMPSTLERISTASDSYTVALPEEWLYRTCEDTDILFLAPSEDLLGICSSGYFGAISISRSAGDTTAEGDPRDDPSLIDVEVSDVTIDGQPATKVSYTVGESDFLTPGAEYIRYQIYYEGNTYTIGTGREPTGVSFAVELDGLVRSFRFSE